MYLRFWCRQVFFLCQHTYTIFLFIFQFGFDEWNRVHGVVHACFHYILLCLSWSSLLVRRLLGGFITGDD